MGPGEHRLSSAERRQLLCDLADLIACRSVSGDARFASENRRTAAWLARRLERAGLAQVLQVDAGGPPVVVARTPRRRGARPSVLVYAHYDVQPAGRRGWTSPPYRLSVRGQDAVGRGTADDKGPLLAHVVAVQRLLARGVLPVDVVFLLDGEEEVGSPHLPAALDRLGVSTRPDVVLMSDTRMASTTLPALVSRLRGSVTLEVELRTGSPVLHAGAWGGRVRGAAADMAAILASLPGSGGRAEAARTETVCPGTGHALCPALTVTCLRSGGRVTAVPNTAWARLNLRTVVGQDPSRVAAAVEQHLRRRLALGATVEVRRGPATPAVVADVRGPAARAAAAAYVDAFGAEPVILPSGGTIPAVAHLKAAFDAPVVLMGFTPPSARIHAPDERMHLPVLWRAVAAAARFHEHLARA